MATQMIIRIEPVLKERVSRLAKTEGKNLSELVRELLENYLRERDPGNCIDELWDTIGKRLHENGMSGREVEKVIAEVRAGND